MALIETQVNGAKLIVEEVDLGRKRGMVDSSSKLTDPKRVDDFLSLMTPVVEGIVDSGYRALAALPERPDELSLGFSMGYSTELNAWVVKGNASLTFDVTIKWKKSKNEESE